MKHFEKKAVVVSGYPKSGTTWATRLVAQLLDCPAKGYWGFGGKSLATEGLDQESDLFCFQAHQYHHELEKTEDFPRIHKIIYVVRDPRDIVISGIYHFSFYSQSLLRFSNSLLASQLKRIENRLHGRNYKIQRMIDMLEHGDKVIDHCDYQWDKHVQSYSDIPGVLFLRYEDMLRDTLELSKRILRFCNIEKSDKAIQLDIDQQSFEFKKKQFAQSKNLIKAKHLRKGVSGDWKNHLPNKYAEKIEQKFGQTMKKLGYL